MRRARGLSSQPAGWHARPVPGDQTRGRVLVIDDSQIVRASLSRLLSEAGYRVYERSTAVGASAIIVRHDVQVVILDIIMPVMSGERFAGILRSNDRLDHVKLIMITSDAALLDEVAERVGADAALTKAEARTQLLEVVSSVLSPDEKRPLRRLGLRLGSVRMNLPLTGAVKIGRGMTVDVLLDDVDASREHARILVDEAGARIEDLGSRNGTHVNGERLERPQPLLVGDVILIGSTELEVLDVSADQRSVRRRSTQSLEKA